MKRVATQKHEPVLTRPPAVGADVERVQPATTVVTIDTEEVRIAIRNVRDIVRAITP